MFPSGFLSPDCLLKKAHKMAKQNESKRITETTLKSLTPSAKEWYVRDTQLRGFHIRVHPSGSVIYQVEARLGGKGRPKKFKIGNVHEIPLDEARQKATQALKLIREGTDPSKEKQARLFEGITLEQLLKKYLENRKNLKQRTRHAYTYQITKCCKQWLNTRVKDIHKHEVLEWYHEGKNTPTHTHGAYRVLHTLMEYAEGLEIINENPCKLIKKTKAAYSIKKRETYLEPNQDLGKFLKAFIEYDFIKDSQKAARDLIVLMLTTGLRFGEARSIKFSNIDFERKVLVVKDTKNRRDHIVPLVAMTFTMLRLRKESEDKPTYVFPIKKRTAKAPYVTDIRKTLAGICKKAGITEITPHDLRRTFASALNDIGVGYSDTKALMNHKTKDITAVYIQNNAEKLRRYLIDVVRYYDTKITIGAASSIPGLTLTA